ncbi:hypothetical protein MKUB_54470 [Mycobacterium kubicae]|uniref:Uncharacterized protein n=1 Tax=Mycobacterium kubicae TaxID=120959 RepID=A0ABQ1BW37_9MYCO|nr:hypothetical protein MKUB_54470 [Mycobacterium kubicae]
MTGLCATVGVHALSGQRQRAEFGCAAPNAGHLCKGGWSFDNRDLMSKPMKCQGRGQTGDPATDNTYLHDTTRGSSKIPPTRPVRRSATYARSLQIRIRGYGR